MSYGRRITDRRRRVLYSSRNAENESVTAASRRAALRLREARSPSAAYGSRVQRRLRGRWFSLVPVRRRALISWSGAVGLLVTLLCAAHYASVTWPSIASRPEIARALRLDRPDSFGQWVTSALLAGCAGVSLLIYQLRRHKNDDFRGHYRLWRLVLLVMMLASVDSVASLVEWSGALLDAGFGRRVALSGNDWLRIALSIAGTVLALRLSVEVRRSKWALTTMLLAWAVLSLPIAARWNFLAVDSIGRWTLVTSAPLLASAMLFVSLGGYLRMLYREVRNITDNRSITQRLAELRMRVFDGSDEDEVPEKVAAKRKVVVEKESPRKRWFGRERGTTKDRKPDPRRKKIRDDDSSEDSDDEAVTKPREKRRWFGSQKSSKVSTKDETAAEDDSSPEAEASKRRRFSLRLRSSAPASASNDDDEQEPDSQTVDEDASSDAKPKKRFGLGGWMNRDKGNEDASSSSGTNGSERTDRGASRSQSSSASERDKNEQIDLDGIDWSSMSKAERRRLRKKLKREGRAA